MKKEKTTTSLYIAVVKEEEEKKLFVTKIEPALNITRVNPPLWVFFFLTGPPTSCHLFYTLYFSPFLFFSFWKKKKINKYYFYFLIFCCSLSRAPRLGFSKKGYTGKQNRYSSRRHVRSINHLFRAAIRPATLAASREKKNSPPERREKKNWTRVSCMS